MIPAPTQWKPVPVLGTGQLSGRAHDPQAEQLLRQAVKAGIQHFDSADTDGMSQVEELLGRVLENRPRSSFFLCTKTGFEGSPVLDNGALHPDRLEEACHHSLNRLKVAYLDTYLCHCSGYTTGLVAIAAAMKKLYEGGHIREWGFCNWTRQDVSNVLSICRNRSWPRPTVAQYELNLYTPPSRREFIAWLRSQGFKTMACAPFAGGLLAGGSPQIRENEDEQVPAERYTRRRLSGFNQAFTGLAHRSGHEPAELAWTWTAHQSGVCQIVFGASNPIQIRQIAGYSAHHFEPGLRAQIEELERRHPFREVP